MQNGIQSTDMKVLIIYNFFRMILTGFDLYEVDLTFSSLGIY